MTSTSAVALCQFCKKPPGTKVGPPAMVKCLTMGCEGANLAAVTVAEWNAPSTPAPTAAGALAVYEKRALQIIKLATEQAEEIRALRNSAPQETRGDEPERLVGEDLLADMIAAFSHKLLEKLRAAQAKGRHGWDRDDWKPECQRGLNNHLAKGDPLDVAAYCAFLWYHGWPTVGPLTPEDVKRANTLGAPQQSPRLERAAIALTLYDLRFPHRNWSMASTDERALSLKQADAILALLSPPGPMVPWELDCQRKICAAPVCECPVVTSTSLCGTCAGSGIVGRRYAPDWRLVDEPCPHCQLVSSKLRGEGAK